MQPFLWQDVLLNDVFGKCLLGQPIFCHTAKYRFFVQTAKNTKEKTSALLSERFDCDPRFKSAFRQTFMFARVQDCQNNNLLEQKLIK